MSGNGRRNEAHAGPSYCEGRNARGGRRKSWTVIFGMVSEHGISGEKTLHLHRIYLFQPLYLGIMIPLPVEYPVANFKRCEYVIRLLLII